MSSLSRNLRTVVRFNSTSITHDFSCGDYLIKIDNGEISHYFVDAVVSPETLRVRLVKRDGTLSNIPQEFSGLDLNKFKLNYVANNLITNSASFKRY